MGSMNSDKVLCVKNKLQINDCNYIILKLNFKGIMWDRQWKACPQSGFYHIDADFFLSRNAFQLRN